MKGKNKMKNIENRIVYRPSLESLEDIDNNTSSIVSELKEMNVSQNKIADSLEEIAKYLKVISEK